MRSFVIFTDWRKIFELLPTDSERVSLLYLIFSYMNDQEIRIEEETESVRTAWEFISPKLEENKKKYRDKLERIRNVNETKSSRNRYDVDTISSRNRNDIVGVTDTVTVTVTDTVTDTVDKLSTNVSSLSVKENSKEKRFKKPTLEEVELFILDNSYQDEVNAEVFYSYYESKGWKVGKSPMKDWKAAVRGWASRERKKRQDSEPDDFMSIDWGDAL